MTKTLAQRLIDDRLTSASLVLLLLLALASLSVPLLPLADPAQTALGERLLTPFAPGHLLGTDQLGRDIASRLLHGTRLSLVVALFGVLVAAVGGSLVGLVSGYYEGRVDAGLMRLVDVLMAFPYLLLALAIVAVLGPGLKNATIAIAIVNIPFFARTVRGQTLSLKREAFVDAARVLGLGDFKILFSEILPGLLSTIVVAASTSMGWMILETAGLSFLGLGAQPPTADLGGMLGQGRHLLATAPHVSLIPGGLIFVVVALFNIVGDGLRDVLDPRDVGRMSSEACEHDVERDSPSEAIATLAHAKAGEAALLRVEALTIHFGAFMAVDSASFGLARGEKLALVGESGSGKSVTALSLLGLLPKIATLSGKIEFEGQELAAVDAAEFRHLRGRIAYIPQDPLTSLHPLLRVERQLTEALELQRKVSGAAARREALELLREVGIVDPQARLRAFPHQLSGGMRQRVVIAMALASSPKLLIADEPTTALDVTTQANVLDRLQHLCATHGTALLFISHDLSLVSQLCDRVLVMRRGRLVDAGLTGDIVQAPEHDYTRQLMRAVPQLGNPRHILFPEQTG